jgi:hypothetical protein
MKKPEQPRIFVPYNHGMDQLFLQPVVRGEPE